MDMTSLFSGGPGSDPEVGESGRTVESSPLLLRSSADLSFKLQ